MQKYSQYRPTQHDCAGLNLPDQQSWFVLNVGRNRDSGCLAESNFATALKILGGESETCEVHRFGHWACGWFEIILLSPEREEDGNKIENSLADYPVLDDDDFSERESVQAEECWELFGAAEMRKHLSKTFELSITTYRFLSDISHEALREFHAEHSMHDYESDDEGAKFDFMYISKKYAHWPENLRLSRDDLAKFLREQRKAIKSKTVQGEES